MSAFPTTAASGIGGARIRIIGWQRRHRAREVAARRLYLNYVGTEIGEQRSAERSGKRHRAIDNGDVSQRTRSFTHCVASQLRLPWTASIDIAYCGTDTNCGAGAPT